MGIAKRGTPRVMLFPMTQPLVEPLSFAPYVPRIVREWLNSPDPTSMHQSIEGTAVFVDVSGFTRMSERMARLGKVGAEEVTGIIGDTFSQLLEEAYVYGTTHAPTLLLQRRALQPTVHSDQPDGRRRRRTNATRRYELCSG